MNSQATVLASALSLLFALPSLAQSSPPAVLPENGAGQPVSVMIGASQALIPDPILGIGEGPGDMAGGDAIYTAREVGLDGGFAGLGLSDDQYEKLFAIKREALVRKAAHAAQMTVAELTLHDVLLQPALDRVKIQAAQDSINQVRTAAANDRLDSTIKLLSVLTVEQRQQLRKRTIREMVGGALGTPRAALRVGRRPGHNAMTHPGSGK